MLGESDGKILYSIRVRVRVRVGVGVRVYCYEIDFYASVSFRNLILHSPTTGLKFIVEEGSGERKREVEPCSSASRCYRSLHKSEKTTNVG